MTQLTAEYLGYFPKRWRWLVLLTTLFFIYQILSWLGFWNFMYFKAMPWVMQYLSGGWDSSYPL